MVKITSDNLDLERICISGQCFRMKKDDDRTFIIIAGSRFLRAGVSTDAITFDCTLEEYEEFWKKYFDIDRDYEKIIALADDKDEYLKDAIQKGKGIRILHQDLWEMLISFIISQQNNITRITKCIENICIKYGSRKTAKDGSRYYAFPTPKQLAGASLEELRECNLGYRAEYVLGAARGVCNKTIDLDRISHMNYEDSRKELLKIYGVGPKVADCICLFALAHTQAFPKDTHINQALEAHYKGGFPMEQYNPYQGIFQQYIFYKELHG